MPGAGMGGTLVHLLREGCEVYALDGDPEGVEHVRRLAESLGAGLPDANFRVGAIERMPFADGLADVVICNSVLHFARDEDHFRRCWRSFGGYCGWVGCCSAGWDRGLGWTLSGWAGICIGSGDGSAWYLVDEEMLLELTEELNGVMVDPLKTTVVQDYRCMTTWVLRKRRG